MCQIQLMDRIGGPYECDLPLGHLLPHICYCDDGESCDNAQIIDEDDPEADYETETVHWTVRWPEEGVCSESSS